MLRSATTHYDFWSLTGKVESVGVAKYGIGKQGWRRDLQILVREAADVSKAGQQWGT